MKKLLVILMTILTYSVIAQNNCSTKEQNNASQKVCEKTIEGLAGVAGAAACSPLGAKAAAVCGVLAGAASTQFAERHCNDAREAHEKKTPQCESNSTTKEKSEFITNQTFGETKSGSNNCSASNVKYTSKARR